MQIREAQQTVKEFATKNKWKDEPSVDKFDHVHEELIEMSQYLRYKNEEERKEIVEKQKEIFVDGIGDLLFSVFRLSNQLNVDAEEAFRKSSDLIIKKYEKSGKESKIIRM